VKEGLIKTIAYFEDLLREPGIIELVSDDPQKKTEATEVKRGGICRELEIINARNMMESH
jgi:hypothetical protein